MNIDSIIVFFEYLKVLIHTTHEGDEGDCTTNHNKLHTLLACARKNVDLLVADVLINTPVEGINHTTTEEEPMLTPYPAAYSNDARDHMSKMNVRVINSIEDRTFHVIPEMIPVEYMDREELTMLLMAMAHEANVIGYVGVLDHSIFVVTRTESYFAESGRIVAVTEPKRTSTSQRYTAYWVYGIVEGRDHRIFRTGSKFNFWAEDKFGVKAILQEKLTYKHTGIIGCLVYGDGDQRFYITREVAKPIATGIVRRNAFS